MTSSARGRWQSSSVRRHLFKNGGIKISRRALRDWVNQQAIADSGTLDIH
ncbi:O-succinylbenzoic acid--CoA ligase [Cronobacter sakazakii 701]|nr:O-succinylbenzoic acid--CoA ligase [Cronobacter sakazakii 701]